MNAVFNFNRWVLYVSKYWNENKRKYLISLAAIGGILILWYSFLMIVNKRNPLQLDMQIITYYVGLFITGCLFASMQFNELGDGPRGISFLLLPASMFEKLLNAILFSAVLYFICYTAAFYVIDFVLVKVSNSIATAYYEREKLGRFNPQQIANVFSSPNSVGDNLFLYVLVIYFGIQSIFLLGSVYFSKYSYIKTLVWGLIVFLVLIFYQHNIMESFMPNGGFFKPFTVYRIWENDKELMVRIPEWISSILIFLLMYTLAPALWVVTYFRLKEKEV